MTAIIISAALDLKSVYVLCLVLHVTIVRHFVVHFCVHSNYAELDCHKLSKTPVAILPSSTEIK